MKMRPIGVISEAVIETLGDIWDPAGVTTKRVDLAAVDIRVVLTLEEQLDINPSLVKLFSDGGVSFWSESSIKEKELHTMVMNMFFDVVVSRKVPVIVVGVWSV